MAGIIDFPTVVQEALRTFGDLLPNEPQRRHFAEYLTGLFVADRKNVAAINREFAQTTDQSCLNRFLTEADWDVGRLNQRRLDFLQGEPSTRYSAQGVIPIDNTLIDHCGQLIADVGWYWDHAEERYKVAHDYLIANYVCSSGKHYPLDFRRFQKEDLCHDLEIPFKDHTVLTCELIDWVCAQHIPGTFAFDSYFTNAKILRASGRNEVYVSTTNLRQIRPQANWRKASWSSVPRSNRRRSRPKLCSQAIVRSTNQRYTPRPLPCSRLRSPMIGVMPSHRNNCRTGSES